MNPTVRTENPLRKQCFFFPFIVLGERESGGEIVKDKKALKSHLWYFLVDALVPAAPQSSALSPGGQRERDLILGMPAAPQSSALSPEGRGEEILFWEVNCYAELIMEMISVGIIIPLESFRLWKKLLCARCTSILSIKSGGQREEILFWEVNCYAELIMEMISVGIIIPLESFRLWKKLLW
ncbi:hypothetical protein CEXT_377771 [Caerostris extrusa]|uniref:Uncharacterized protein n=1 Tax=Caerostris extrusa TaxID=172846 RepID=A0AAV4S1K8_CAEEX|nr:hypothetical protein CEXT_377771 [Caerostris extrusa]